MPVMFVKKTFSDKSDMKRHELIHSGQRPYACNVCKKTFSVKSDMKIHQLIHSEQRPYARNVCKKNIQSEVSHEETPLNT